MQNLLMRLVKLKYNYIYLKGYMMEFLQQGHINRNSYTSCRESEANFFRDPNDGRIRPINELKQIANNNFVSNVPKATHEPLGIPSMDSLINEKSGQVHNVTISKNNEKGLPLPSLTQMILEDAKQRNKFNSQNIKPIKNQNYDSHGLPSMDYLIKNKS